MLLSCSLFGQQTHDWPHISLDYHVMNGNPVSYQSCDGQPAKHRVVDDPLGKEYYCSGHLHAQGPLVLVDSSIVINLDGTEETRLKYARHGKWLVYYDSSKHLLRTEGSFNRGKEDGIWRMYTLTGKPRYEYQFVDGTIVKEVHYDAQGNQQVVLASSRVKVFYERHKTLILYVMFLVVILLRSLWNMVTFYKIKNSRYASAFDYWKKEGATAALLSPFIFWWLRDAGDTSTVRFYKRWGNVIAIVSILVFVVVMAMASLK
ncbi:MAG TPA: hypothetical protein VD794_14375 [Flavisolibacter sp.]|nr:hypothetical protein [Flavisolibacter sp.]